MSPETYAACYTAGRDWAEEEALRACPHGGPIPPTWEPPFEEAHTRACVAAMPADTRTAHERAIGKPAPDVDAEAVDLVIRSAKESWSWFVRTGY